MGATWVCWVLADVPRCEVFVEINLYAVGGLVVEILAFKVLKKVKKIHRCQLSLLKTYDFKLRW